MQFSSNHLRNRHSRNKRKAALYLILSGYLLGVFALLASQAQSDTPAQPPPQATSATHLPADSAHSGAYSLPFGPNPYLPSETHTDYSGFLKPAEIPTAAYCGRCHAQVHAEWRQSAHSNSFRTPWYVKNVEQLAKEKGVEFTRHCESCHNPSALLTGALTPGSTVARPNDDDGITCMNCHSIRRVESTRGIGSYVMGRPAVLVDAQGQPIPGLPPDAEILAHLDRHRQAVMQPVYRTSEYCASCHKAALPVTLNDYKWLRTFSTYDEWQQSSWSTETPLPFYTKPVAASCQSCHMAGEPYTAEPSRYVASHRWLGANTAVPTQYGYTEQLRQTEQFLQAGQLAVDIFGVTVERTRAAPGSVRFTPGTVVAPLGSRPFDVLPGDWLRVDVVIRNKGIGHSLVPELRDFYESWVEFEAVGDDGKVIYQSGAQDDKHEVDPEGRSYVTRVLSNTGAQVDHHEVWKFYVRAYDATILPGRSDVVRYRFRVPEGVHGFHVSARVRYRRFNRAFTNWVFGDSPSAPDRFPTVDMASGSFHFAVGHNAVLAPTGSVAPDATVPLRWNNYGIGMIDRQQFAEAVNAFEHVVAIDPAYEPGYVNVAIAEYMRGRYPASLSWLDRAAKLNPTASRPDQRAAFYRGLCLRWTNHYDDAIATLRPIADAFPRFRQVHQELGYLYMVQRRMAESRAEYEAVLRIDPDDPTTHRWLGAVYAALGDPIRSAQETLLAAQTGNDTAAGWTAQRFWRENLALASEAMPTHTHSEANKADDADVQRVLQLQNPPSYIWIEQY